MFGAIHLKSTYITYIQTIYSKFNLKIIEQIFKDITKLITFKLLI